MTREPDEEARVLSIGSVVGGRTASNRAWIDEIALLTRDVAAAREGVRSTLNINVVFHVAGNLRQPDFEGVRTGTFRKADSLLMVQVALPERAPPLPRRALLGLLERAVADAQGWSDRRHLAFDPEPFRRILSAVAGG